MAAATLLTDRLLRSWVRCKRRAWLDVHGPAQQRQWNAHRALALQEQVQSFQALVAHKPGHGLAACQQGDGAVVGLRLRGDSPTGSHLEAHPPLLLRGPGRSVWGDWTYQPVLARQGYRVTREHRLQLALWGRLLAPLQQAAVSHGVVVAGGGRQLQQERLALGGSLQRQLDESLQRLAADLARSEAPALVADRKKCTLCSWRGLCDGVAAAEGHLSEVSGIGGKRRELLLAQGITTLVELAASDPEELATRLELADPQHGKQHAALAADLVAQARVQAGGAPLRLDPAAALPELQQAPGVLLYDIESDPDARDDFLHGFVVLERDGAGRWPEAVDLGAPGARYIPLLALQEHGERRLWQRLQRLLAAYPAWPLLHYGETEALALVRLAQRQGASEAQIEQLRARLIDLHARLRRCWRLPVGSYGLKAVAGWLGFHWSQRGVDGARCLLWWRQWRQWHRDPGPRGRTCARHLRQILAYNCDDSLASWAVAYWLLQQDGLTPEVQR
ncbi:MAG: TM0106 family RecB-like putative nuclease [Cyanobacteriota bacterium]|nr:TM0106 family RecB-like putative nuclease [Cyanobacteriota bacterium]